MVIRNYADVKVHIKTEDILKENVIYRFTFPNGKFYIGQTVQKLRIRLSGHCTTAFKLKHNEFDNIKSRAIRKYMQFEVDILYQGDNLDEEEIKFIEMHKSTNPEYGYNLDEGGKGSTGHKMPKELLDKLRIINSKQLSGKTGKNAIRATPITQYDIEMNYIRDWDTVNEAADTLGISRTGVSNCLNGWSKSAGGFIFKHKNK